MPSGVQHDRITMAILPIIVGITYLITRNFSPRDSGELTLILAGSYLFSGMMFGPDLDIHSLQYQRWGFIKIIWLPYRRLVKHRSLLSHGLAIGTCLRLIYLGSIVAIVSIFAVAIAQLWFGFPWNWQVFVRERVYLSIREHPHAVIACLLGLEIGAMSHSISDWFSSWRKLRLKKRSAKSNSTVKPSRSKYRKQK